MLSRDMVSSALRNFAGCPDEKSPKPSILNPIRTPANLFQGLLARVLFPKPQPSQPQDIPKMPECGCQAAERCGSCFHGSSAGALLFQGLATKQGHSVRDEGTEFLYFRVPTPGAITKLFFIMVATCLRR